ncbi:MAG TPA: MFS transporter [Acidimicrobiales bacterium]|nr:MFS transporter [Acidimicrobiales bacterium]
MTTQLLATRGLRLATARTFRSLRNRNYRLFFSGQLVSLVGTGMQVVAQSWLVLTLSNSGVALGVTAALQFAPMLVIGVWGGVVADRFDKRRVLIATQVTSALLAFVLGLLVVSGAVTLWMVYVLAFLLGLVNVVDLPTRHAFVIEMVGGDEVPNAVGLNSAVFNTGRLVGPAVAGVLIASVGVASCFLINALSYVPVIAGLAAMRTEELFRQAPVAAGPGPVRAGLRYVWSTPELRSTILLVAVIGVFGLNFVVVVPLLARFVLGGGPRLYGALSSAMALGSVIGALVAAARGRPTRRLLLGGAAAFGLLTMAAAAAPTALAVGLLLVPTGLALMLFLATANTTLQLASDAAMRGRVMALYGLVFLGSTPLGGPLMGWVSEQWGARAGLAAGGAVSLAAAVVAACGEIGRRRRLRSVTVRPADEAGDALDPVATEAV